MRQEGALSRYSEDEDWPWLVATFAALLNSRDSYHTVMPTLFTKDNSSYETQGLVPLAMLGESPQGIGCIDDGLLLALGAAFAFACVA